MKRQKLIDEVNSFENIGDNWDGCGGIQPLNPTIQNTIKVLGTLVDDIILTIDETRLTPYGTIVMDLETKSTLISLEIGKESMGYFIEVDNKDVELRDELYLIGDTFFNIYATSNVSFLHSSHANDGNVLGSTLIFIFGCPPGCCCFIFSPCLYNILKQMDLHNLLF